MVSVGGNFYSVPNGAKRRVVEVHSLADEIRIFEEGRLIATHPVLEGRGQRRVAAGHRTTPPPPTHGNAASEKPVMPPSKPGHSVPSRPLAFYDAVGKRLARQDRGETSCQAGGQA